jgi:hypothetical protein
MSNERLAEPYDPSERPVRWGVLCCAAAVAVGLAWLAPRSWDAGTGKVEVVRGEETVFGTPPTMIAYATKLFTAREIFKRGLPLDLIGVALLVTAVLGLWKLFGLV